MSLILTVVWPIVRDFIIKHYDKILLVGLISGLSFFAWYEHKSFVDLKQDIAEQQAKAAMKYAETLGEYIKDQQERDIMLNQQIQAIEVGYEDKLEKAASDFHKQMVDLEVEQKKAIAELEEKKKKKIEDTVISTSLDPEQRARDIAKKYGFKVVE